MCPYWFLDTVVIVFQQKHSKIAVLIVLMASQREVVVISFLYAFGSKMVAQILLDDLLFPVLAVIVNDDTEEREIGLLSAKTVQGCRNIRRVIEGCAAHPDFIVGC